MTGSRDYDGIEIETGTQAMMKQPLPMPKESPQPALSFS